MSSQSVGEMGKDFCPNFQQPFLENCDRSSCYDGSWGRIPVFHKFHQKCRLSPSVVTRNLEYLVGVSSKASTKPSQLQVMKPQPMQPLFVGEVMHARYQPCSRSMNSLKMLRITIAEAPIR